MEPSHHLYELLTDDCRQAFERLHSGLPRVLPPSRQLPILDFQLWNRYRFNARVRHPGGNASQTIVEVNTGLLHSVFNTIESSAESVHSCVLGSTPNEIVDRDVLCSIVYDAALHFVLLHEIYHVYEGHMAFLLARKGISVFQELGRCFDGSDENLDPETAYFLEFEADGSALVSLLTHIEFEPLIEVVSVFESLGDHCVMVQDFPGVARDIGFRIIMCATWIVASLMEQGRNIDQQAVLPRARMLSLVSTLMSWYAELDNLQQTEDGELIQRLDDSHVGATRAFLHRIAKPVLITHWQLHSADSDKLATAGYNARDIEQFARDLQTLLFRQPTRSVASQQVVSCERIRTRVEPLLKPHRYIKL